MIVNHNLITHVLIIPRHVLCCYPFQAALFSKIVPNCKKLGLLDPNDGWLRKRFQEIGVIQFEDWVDTGEEYLAFDAVAQDRAAAAAAEAG